MNFFTDTRDLDAKCFDCDRRSHSCTCDRDLPPVQREEHPICFAPSSRPLTTAEGMAAAMAAEEEELDAIFPEPSKPKSSIARSCIDSMVRETHTIKGRTFYVWHVDPQAFVDAGHIRIIATKLITKNRFYVPDCDWKKNREAVVIVDVDERAFVLTEGWLSFSKTKSEALNTLLGIG